MKRLILLLLFVGAFSVLSLAARSNDYTDVISVAPTVSFQRILYEVPQYNNKNGMGLGLLASYDSFKTDRSSLGLQLSAEYFDYPISYDYFDLKLSGTFKFRLIPLNTPDTTARLFMSLGAGADFVFREDGDFGTYIHLTGGLEFILYGDDGSDVVLRTDVAGTFQQGSTVFHASVGLGVRMGFGEKFETAKPEPEPVEPEIIKEEPQIIEETPVIVIEEPRHVHTTDGTWVYDDLNHWHVCEECGESFDVHEHDYPSLPNLIQITQFPEQEVKWFHVCSICGCMKEGYNPYYGIKWPEPKAEPVEEPVAEEPAEEIKEETVSLIIEVVDSRDEAVVEEILPEHIHTYNILPEIIIIEHTEDGLDVTWYHVCQECGELIEDRNPFYDAIIEAQQKGGSV